MSHDSGTLQLCIPKTRKPGSRIQQIRIEWNSSADDQNRTILIPSQVDISIQICGLILIRFSFSLVSHPSLIPNSSRKHHKDRSIRDSIFRPDNPANERLFKWKSPYSDRNIDTFSNRSQSVRDGAVNSMKPTFIRGTIPTYASGLLRFTQMIAIRMV